MLDEIKEFENYLDDIKKDQKETSGRIKYNTFLKCQNKNYSFSGSDRFLTILARGILFGVYGRDRNVITAVPVDHPRSNEQLYSTIDDIIVGMDPGVEAENGDYDYAENGDYANAKSVKCYSRCGLSLWLGKEKEKYYQEWASVIDLKQRYPLAARGLADYLKYFLLNSKLEEIEAIVSPENEEALTEEQKLVKQCLSGEERQELKDSLKILKIYLIYSWIDREFDKYELLINIPDDAWEAFAVRVNIEPPVESWLKGEKYKSLNSKIVEVNKAIRNAEKNVKVYDESDPEHENDTYFLPILKNLLKEVKEFMKETEETDSQSQDDSIHEPELTAEAELIAIICNIFYLCKKVRKTSSDKEADKNAAQAADQSASESINEGANEDTNGNLVRIGLYNTPEDTLINIVNSLQEIDKRDRELDRDIIEREKSAGSRKKSARSEETSAGYKTLTYAKITSKAVFQGTLRRYALCCKTPYFEKIYIKNDAERENKPIVEKGKFSKKKDMTINAEEDLILRMTAACLLEMTRLPSCNGRENIVWNWPSAQGEKKYIVHRVPVNYTDLTNWSTRKKIFQGADFNKYRFSGKDYDEILFETGLRGGNQAVVTMNQTWCEECDWHLLDITESDQPIKDFLADHPDYQVYIDQGSGKKLKKWKPAVKKQNHSNRRLPKPMY